MSEYQRWRLNATLQLELYNCPDQSEAAYLKGSARRHSVFEGRDVIELRALSQWLSCFLLSCMRYWEPQGDIGCGRSRAASNSLDSSLQWPYHFSTREMWNTSEFLDKASSTYPRRQLVNSLSNDYMYCIHQIFPWSTLNKNYTNESKMNNWKKYFAFLKNCPKFHL